jgi:hypothetical protein
MQGHLQNLVKQGFRMKTELMGYRVLENPAFPAPADGYMVTFVASYERGFSAPSHQFLHSLL